nr:hypothetical protein Iba_chr03cCG6720 [Ipomoea batatas]
MISVPAANLNPHGILLLALPDLYFVKVELGKDMVMVLADLWDRGYRIPPAISHELASPAIDALNRTHFLDDGRQVPSSQFPGAISSAIEESQQPIQHPDVRQFSLPMTESLVAQPVPDDRRPPRSSVNVTNHGAGTLSIGGGPTALHGVQVSQAANTLPDAMRLQTVNNMSQKHKQSIRPNDGNLENPTGSGQQLNFGDRAFVSSRVTGNATVRPHNVNNLIVNSNAFTNLNNANVGHGVNLINRTGHESINVSVSTSNVPPYAGIGNVIGTDTNNALNNSSPTVHVLNSLNNANVVPTASTINE